MSIYSPPTINAVQKTLGAQLLSGVTAAATLNNVVGIPNAPGVMVVDRVDSSGTSTASLREYIAYTGTSGSTVTGLTRNADSGGTDQDHAVGAVVEFVFDVVQMQAIKDTFETEHAEAGTHDATKVAMLAGAQTITGAKTFTTGLLKAVDITSGAGVSTLPTSTDTLVGRATTDTLTNKRINPRIVTAASYTTDTGTSLDVSTCDEFDVTAQAGALKLNNPSGTPVNGQKLIVRIKDNGTARALTYDTQFRASSDLALPTTTVLGKTLYLGFVFNSADTKWDLLAVLNNI
jgi:hypothetical protein